MEDDPQFVYTIHQLKMLAELMISGEEGPIEKIHKLFYKSQL